MSCGLLLAVCWTVWSRLVWSLRSLNSFGRQAAKPSRIHTRLQSSKTSPELCSATISAKTIRNHARAGDAAIKADPQSEFAFPIREEPDKPKPCTKHAQYFIRHSAAFTVRCHLIEAKTSQNDPAFACQSRQGIVPMLWLPCKSTLKIGVS